MNGNILVKTDWKKMM